MTRPLPDPRKRRGARRFAWAPVCALLIFDGCSGPSAFWVPVPDPPRSRVHGMLEIVHHLPLGPLAIVPAVVYLEPTEARDETVQTSRDRTPEPARVRHDGRGFAPGFVAIGPGQGLALTNTSGVHHRIFWLQGGERFTVDLPPDPGAVVPVELGRRGLVRFYCELHSDEYFSVYVAPSPHFALLESPGPYAMEGVTPGEWRLAIWSEAVAGRIRDVTVAPHEDSEQDLRIDARTANQQQR
jgi:plastocyanin